MGTALVECSSDNRKLSEVTRAEVGKLFSVGKPAFVAVLDRCKELEDAL
jgi:hypothetical protein